MTVQNAAEQNGPTELLDWQVRLVDEARDLEAKLSKLYDFLLKIETGHKHYDALIKQSVGMATYMLALNDRLRIEGIEPSLNSADLCDKVIENTKYPVLKMYRAAPVNEENTGFLPGTQV